MGFLKSHRTTTERDDGKNRWFLFRRGFTLADVCPHAPLRVTVDGRYKLFVNGVFVGRGPIRCNPMFQRYDEYDVAPHLRPGANVIALIVHTYGVDTSWYETVKGMWRPTFGDGAVWLECDHAPDQTIGTDLDWRCLKAIAWNSATARMNMGLGFIEELDARALPMGWDGINFDDSAWEPVHELRAGGGGPEGFFSGMETRPFPTLVARMIPALAECPQRPARFLRADALAPRPDLSVEARCFAELASPAEGGMAVHAAQLCLEHGGPATVRTTQSQDVTLLFEFETLLTAYPYIEVEGIGGEIIEIACAEQLPGEWGGSGMSPDARITPVPMLGLDAHVCRYTARPGRQFFERFEWSAVRWMQVTIRNAPTGITIHALGARQVNYPVQEAGPFTASDPFFSKLWSVGANTLKLCMHDGWEDCPSREQRQWLGDATVEHLVGQVAFGPDVTPLNALFLRQAAESQRPDGLTQMFAPGDHHTNGLLIPDWTLQWILNAGDHWLYSGDRETIEAIYPTIQKAIGWFERQTSPAGLLADLPYWHFMDWAAFERRGESCATNALYAGALDAAAMLGTALGNGRAADQYRSRAIAVRAALNERHWDAERGIFIDSVDPRSGARGKRVSQHANAAMILWGQVPAERLPSIIDAITDDGRLVFTPAPPITNHSAPFDEARDVVLANTFFAHFVYCALARSGHLVEALEMMRARLGPMIEKGSPTLWESLEPSASLCHGFSASPTYIMGAHVLGVRPATAGFGEAIFAPDIASFGSASGSVPTPAGPIAVALTRTDAGFSATYTAPPGMPIRPQAAPGWFLDSSVAEQRGAVTIHFRKKG